MVSGDRSFAIGALVYDDERRRSSPFCRSLPNRGRGRQVGRGECTPEDRGHSREPRRLRRTLTDFAKFYLANKQDADVIVHMGFIVETKILRDMHERGLIGDWDAPYPLYDISGQPCGSPARTPLRWTSSLPRTTCRSASLRVGRIIPSTTRQLRRQCIAIWCRNGLELRGLH